MKLTLTVDWHNVFSGAYDIVAMADALGITELSKNSLPVQKTIEVTIHSHSVSEYTAIAKLVNYAHIALMQQGVETFVDYDAVKQLLVDDEIGSLPPDYWKFEFTNSDDALFFVSVIRNVDFYVQPKWQIWLLPEDQKNITVPEEIKVKVCEPDHFVAHYFHKVTKNILANLTQTPPGSLACLFLDGIRNRIGRNLGVIKTTRVRLTDAQKHQNLLARISEEDRNAAPEEYQRLSENQISLQEFQSTVRAAKKTQRMQARTARQLVSGSKATVVRTLTPGAQARIDAAGKIVAQRRKKSQ